MLFADCVTAVVKVFIVPFKSPKKVGAVNVPAKVEFPVPFTSKIPVKSFKSPVLLVIWTLFEIPPLFLVKKSILP